MIYNNYKNKNDLPYDFNWEQYVLLNDDLKNFKTKIEAETHYKNYGIFENREYKFLEISDDFNWETYLLLNEDLKHFKTKIEAEKHYLNYGILENREYKNLEIPDDFNWKTYLLLNNKLKNKPVDKIAAFIDFYYNGGCFNLKEKIEKIKLNLPSIAFDWRLYLKINNDLIENNITDEISATNHYNNYGYKEKRCFCNNLSNFEILFFGNIIDNKTELFFILNELLNNNQNFVDDYTNFNNFLDKKKIFIKSNFQNDNYKNNISFLEDKNNISFLEDKNNDSFKKNIYDCELLNVYDKFIVIIDLPDSFTGGSKKFINDIVKRYSDLNNFLIIRMNNKNTATFNINEKHLINKQFNYDDLITYFYENKNKILKIFINHFFDSNRGFINFICNLDIEKTVITHDHYNLTLEKTQLIIDEIVENKFHSSLYSKFDKIITQNLNNCYMFSNNDLKKVIVSELPDYKYSDERIITNNKTINALIIGSVSDIKGSEFVTFLFDYCKKIDINIEVFGCVQNYLSDNINKYRNIYEFNELLKNYKPNLIIETSIWPETYSYTLTLSMLTQLPILSLLKPYDSVIKNRLQNYDKKFYFNNIEELTQLIFQNKQDYFYTIKPIIYYNNFWDEYFNYNLDIFNINKNDVNLIKNKIIENNIENKINNKNIVIITSKIIVSLYSFSYSSTRSVYSTEERYIQTLETIQTIRQKIPNSFIILVDNSKLNSDCFEILEENVDIFINVTNNNVLNYYTNICKYKWLSDMTHQLFVYEYFLKHICHTNFKHIFKISGRYLLNETFNYNNFDNSDFIMKKNENVIDRNYYYTSFFKFPNTYLKEYFAKLTKVFYNKEKYFYDDLEVVYSKIFYDKIKLVHHLGVRERIAVWSEEKNANI